MQGEEEKRKKFRLEMLYYTPIEVPRFKFIFYATHPDEVVPLPQAVLLAGLRKKAKLSLEKGKYMRVREIYSSRNNFKLRIYLAWHPSCLHWPSTMNLYLKVWGN